MHVSAKHYCGTALQHPCMRSTWVTLHLWFLYCRWVDVSFAPQTPAYVVAVLQKRKESTANGGTGAAKGGTAAATVTKGQTPMWSAVHKPHSLQT